MMHFHAIKYMKFLVELQTEIGKQGGFWGGG